MGSVTDWEKVAQVAEGLPIIDDGEEHRDATSISSSEDADGAIEGLHGGIVLKKLYLQ